MCAIFFRHTQILISVVLQMSNSQGDERIDLASVHLHAHSGDLLRDTCFTTRRLFLFVSLRVSGSREHGRFRRPGPPEYTQNLSIKKKIKENNIIYNIFRKYTNRTHYIILYIKRYITSINNETYYICLSPRNKNLYQVCIVFRRPAAGHAIPYNIIIYNTTIAGEQIKIL